MRRPARALAVIVLATLSGCGVDVKQHGADGFHDIKALNAGVEKRLAQQIASDHASYRVAEVDCSSDSETDDTAYTCLVTFSDANHETAEVTVADDGRTFTIDG